jgi:uncharacterized damage-inducible protein DinB
VPTKSHRRPRSPALPPSTFTRLRTQLDSLGPILAGADQRALHRRTAEGKWSAHENLSHLARYHEVFLSRLERLLAEDRPQLGRYRAEEDPEAGRWSALPTPEVLRRMKELRARLIKRITRLGRSQLARTGIHPAFGEMPLALWIEFFLVHEAHHLYVTFQRAREGRGNSSNPRMSA